MSGRRERITAAPLFISAAAAYSANVALGTAVATKTIDTTDFRWVHHALYIATCATTAAAIGSALWAQPRPAGRRASALLAPAVLPLAAIPYLGTHSRRHPFVALAAAPFLLAGLVRSLRPPTRK